MSVCLLRLKLQSQSLDVLALSEIRLDDTLTDSQMSIEGYVLIRRDRHRGGGGIGMYIRNLIDFKISSDLSHPDLEFLCGEIKKPGVKPFIFSNWYRPPNTSVELFGKSEVLLEKIEAENTESNIIRDLNCDLMASPSNNEIRHLIELSESYQYVQLIKEPTRITPNSKTLIDLFLTNEPDKITLSGVSHVGYSVHSMIYASRKQASPKLFARVIKSRQYKHFVLDNFLSDIEMVPWAMKEYVDDLIKAWELWKQSFLPVADLHAPFKRKSVKSSSAPWLSNEIKLLMCERDRVKRIAIITGDHMKWTEYKSLKNQVNHFVKAC